MSAQLGLGQSNSSLELILRDGLAFVRKSSQNPTRLRKQYEKHLKLESRLYPLHAPKVVTAFDGNSYEMEFVHGTPFGFALKRLTLNQVKTVADILSEFFEGILDVSKGEPSESLRLSRKIQSFSSNQSVLEFQFGEKSVELLSKHVAELQILSGLNHGDFSFDNTLIQFNSGPIKVFTLDFLDSPFESPLIDLGRFWLDLEYGWWDFDNNKSATWSLNNRIIRSEVMRVAHRHGVSTSTVEYFALFACVRIIPYLKDPHRILFIQSAIKNLVVRSSEWQF
ncbi:Ecdysteroid kinase-like [Candidatus Nanopelagicaceae bacterium]